MNEPDYTIIEMYLIVNNFFPETPVYATIFNVYLSGVISAISMFQNSSRNQNLKTKQIS
jgi:hypothetical protein